MIFAINFVTMNRHTCKLFKNILNDINVNDLMILMLMVLYDFVTNDSREISRLNSTSPLVPVAKDTLHLISGPY